MPAFIRSKQDESRWSRAKQSVSESKSKDEGSFSDRDWALVNHIYQQMSKAEADEFLEKARPYDEDEMPDESEDDYRPDKSEHDEYADEDEAAKHIGNVQEEMGDLGEDSDIAEPSTEKAATKSRFIQPTKDEINDLRSYTMPYEDYLRKWTKLNADPTKNPRLAHHGHIIEANANAFKDRHDALDKMKQSDAYKKGSVMDRMKMEHQFDTDWHENNKDYLGRALSEHHQKAHEKGVTGHSLREKAKQADIQNIIRGGAFGSGGETYSREEAMQHAGGVKGEEGMQGTVTSDPVASFAHSNPDFVNMLAERYKGKPAVEHEDVESPEMRSTKDVKGILGGAPAQSPKFNQFYQHYSPLIESSKKAAVNALGLDIPKNSVEWDLLGEAGLHGLVQSINDYDHENKSKASFATHARNKISGLMMSLLRSKDAIPEEVRKLHKDYMKHQAPKAAPLKPSTMEALPEHLKEKYGKLAEPKAAQPQAAQPQAPAVPTVPAQPTPAPKQPQAPQKALGEATHDVLKQSGHSKSNDVADRLKRVVVKRGQAAAPTPIQPKPEVKPQAAPIKADKWEGFFDEGEE